MQELLKKIPVPVIALCVAVLTVLISIAVIRGDTSIDVWGIKINPRQDSGQKATIANLPVGTVIASYLTPLQIQENYGDEWVLANGDDVSTKSQFFKITGKTRLPDLRGMFLRGMNEGRNDGKQDPQQNRTAGEYQPDVFKEHDHGLVFHYRSFKGDVIGAEGEEGRPALDKPVAGHKNDINKPGFLPKEGKDETRTKNVAVYFYIKIN
jgi:hypothetical protein